jgi:Protein of unknown function (DUF732)
VGRVVDAAGTRARTGRRAPIPAIRPYHVATVDRDPAAFIDAEAGDGRDYSRWAAEVLHVHLTTVSGVQRLDDPRGIDNGVIRSAGKPEEGWIMNLQAFIRRAVPPIMAAVAFGAGLTACGRASSPQPPASSAPATPTTPVAASTVPTLSESELQFVADVRNVLSFGSNVTSSDVASFGQRACGALQSGRTLAGEVQPALRAFPALSKGDAIQLITVAEKDLCPAQLGPQQVTYVATGSSANVTYGPSGSGYQGSVPLTVTRALVGNPQFYSISAQLKAGGTVTCQLKVDGVTIVSATASGTASVASCAMDQNLNGSWEQTTVNG